MTTPTAITTYPAVVGAFVATKRKERGFSQGEIAEKVGLTISTWSRIENGETALTIEQLAQVAHALSMTPGELMVTIDGIMIELSKKGIGTNIERVSSDAIVASGSIPLVGSGLTSAISSTTVVASTAVALETLAGVLAVTATGIPIIGAVAALGLYSWLSGKDQKQKK